MGNSEILHTATHVFQKIDLWDIFLLVNDVVDLSDSGEPKKYPIKIPEMSNKNEMQ